MPFDEEDDTPEPSKVGLKNVSSQKSIFDNMPKKPSQEDFEKKVHQNQEKLSSYKNRAAELSSNYFKIINDKTLKQNKNIFVQDMEKELLTKMIQLAMEINNDPAEAEGMGSLTWIAQLFKLSLIQRDKINQLEYTLSQLEKKLDTNYLLTLISKEIKNLLDKKKDSE